jgi:hypothetical protein
MPAPLYVALLHHPVMDRHGRIVTTSITNMDVHDIARAARTYGVRRFFVVHPVPGLRALAERIVEHWQSGHGSRYNPSRHQAISLACVVSDLDRAIAAAEQDSGQMPYLVATSARDAEGAVRFAELRRRLREDPTPCMLLLGTGYGLADPVFARCDLRLEAIRGAADYNHLSVRAAAAIMLDRLIGSG